MGDVPRVLLILALVATAFWVYTIVDCAVQPPTRHRGVSKPLWIVIVLLLPVIGGVLWLLVGRARRSRVQATRAPDDDPEFLGRIGSISDQDERIRRLEEELALLDAEEALSAPTDDDDAADHEAASTPRDDDDEPRGTRGAA